MASLMENLLDILNKECDEYETLVELSSRKTPVLVTGNIEELEKITDEEQSVVDRITSLDVKRREVTKDIADVMNKDVSSLKLTNLIKMLAQRPEEQAKLSKVFDRLSTTLKEVARINEHNKALIESSLEMTQFNLNVLQAMRSAPETADYTKGGINAGNAYGGSYSRSAFDAKQ